MARRRSGRSWPTAGSRPGRSSAGWPDETALALPLAVPTDNQHRPLVNWKPLEAWQLLPERCSAHDVLLGCINDEWSSL